MNTKVIFMSIRWLSVTAAIAIVSYGFVVPISVIQGLVYNPIILLVILAVGAMATKKLQHIKADGYFHHSTQNVNRA